MRFFRTADVTYDASQKNTFSSYSDVAQQHDRFLSQKFLGFEASFRKKMLSKLAFGEKPAIVHRRVRLSVELGVREWAGMHLTLCNYMPIANRYGESSQLSD